MSFTAAMSQIESAVESISGLSKNPALHHVRMEELGYEGFHGGFSVQAISGPEPFPNVDLSPSAFISGLRIRIGVLVKDDRQAADAQAVEWGVLVQQAMLRAQQPGTDVILLTPAYPPVLASIDETRLVMDMDYFLTHLAE